MLVDGGQFKGRRLLKPETLQLMFTGQLDGVDDTGRLPVRKAKRASVLLIPSAAGSLHRGTGQATVGIEPPQESVSGFRRGSRSKIG